MTTEKRFLGDDFLLENRIAEKLFHDYAKEEPIIDYHNHLPPSEIANNQRYDNISQVWLNGDHYKWRAMRTLGIDEAYITGKASDKEKFMKWAETVPFTLRNPLFHWTHMELKGYFGVSEILKPQSAEAIYSQCNELLQSEQYGAVGLLEKMNVETVCTTDDPIDDLHFHQAHAASNSKVKMFPAFRPDKAILIESEQYVEYINKLGTVVDANIECYPDLINALRSRIDFFAENGCTISDHGLSKIYAKPFTEKLLNQIFLKKLNNEILTDEDCQIFKSGIMHDLGVFYSEKNWVMQLHIGALRNNNSRMLRVLGPDTGFDSIGDYQIAEDLSSFLNQLDHKDKLPRTIIYNLNPRDNEMIATMIGNFNDGSIKGKIQYGSAWWFLDQKDGMEKQLNALSNMGLLSCFVGMLTDSRSFLSFPRHEYFRRILCNLIGKDVVKGELPNDVSWLGEIVKDICYRNAKNYFKFGN